MKFKQSIFGIKIALVLLFLSGIHANEIQLVTTHKKSNGTLLRIVTSHVMDIENIAGWVGQENWFYITLNSTSLNKSSMDGIGLEPPLVDLEATENNESVQLGYLFERPIEDFEIFHSQASRVILIQVWESLSDSIKTEVLSSEDKNKNRVFVLPETESEGSPFYDSFIYAREKYGPEKYFVWYNSWYSTEDSLENPDEFSFPRPLIVKKLVQKKPSPPPPEPLIISKKDIDISFIIDHGFLSNGIRQPNEVKALQRALVALGYDLGSSGVFNNGVDGDYGALTQTAVNQFQSDRGFSSVDVDGIVGESTYRELVRALDDKEPDISYSVAEKVKKVKKSQIEEIFLLETANQILKTPSNKKNVKKEIRKLNNPEILSTLPPDLTKRKTFLTLTCNLDGANVFIDGRFIGQTPISQKLSINPGWHRVRVIDPNATPSQFTMEVPDFQDIYVPNGRTQKIRINLAVSDPGSSE
tara:strand:+ start:1642 stop:3054 length:1413 start_codon:yes stop_codon:yes gene_type:complete